MELADHLRTLADEAGRTNERRLVVLAGDRSSARRQLLDALATAGIDATGWVAVGDLDGPWTALEPARADRLLGRTVPGLVIDAVDELRPNVIGRSVGAVAGGGLVILLAADLDAWQAGPLASDQRLAVEPYTAADVGTRFRRRFVETLRQHPGVSIVDVATETLVDDGTMGDRAPPATCTAGIESDIATDEDLLGACLTADQRECVRRLGSLAADDVAVVEAHRGRGKSAAAGLAAAGFARDGAAVAVIGPGRGAVEEVFERAAAILDTTVDADGPPQIELPGSGRITYFPPHDIEAAVERAAVLFVDEAAAIPVDRLAATLAPGRPVAYLTTVHGYEGTGRGFAVRFRDHLDATDRPVDELRLHEPIRYRQGDPIESWQFRALLLDASPPVASVIESATVDDVAYAAIDRDELVADEALLRELVGLLVLAHYRTEPEDVVRLLDAPNVTVRALLFDGHPVSVAMLAEEGTLAADRREQLYAGESIRGHMLPDLLTTQLRDRDAGEPAGLRVLRIATHDAVRSHGLGSRLLAEIEDEVAGTVDWLGAGFGATPPLVRFWLAAGYRPVHLGTSRNPRSGEHSAVVLRGLSPAGTALESRHARRLAQRLPRQLPDALDDVEPATVEAMLRGLSEPIEPSVPAWMWAVVDATARGPGQVATAPEAFAQLAAAGLADGVGDALTDLERDLVVRRTLQAWPLWEAAEAADQTLGDARGALRSAIDTLWRWHQDD